MPLPSRYEEFQIPPQAGMHHRMREKSEGLLARAGSALPDPSQLLVWVVALAIGAVGGAICHLIGTPLPWLLGSMISVGIAMGSRLKIAGRPLDFPESLRKVFIAVIGIAIGASAEPGMIAELGHWWRSLLAVCVFVVIAQGMNYQLFRRFAGYDRPTAYYCASPGGLVESVELGAEAGGDVARLVIQHFSRITLTVMIIPLIYWLMRGEVVGSAAGVVLGNVGAPVGAWDVALLVGCGIIGGWGGQKVGLPAAIITGPVILSTLVHALGWTEVTLPGWLISLAQLVIGISLALRFGSLTRRLLLQGLGLGALSVILMLGLGALMAVGLALIGEHDFQTLLMCFAPGGVVEDRKST